MLNWWTAPKIWEGTAFILGGGTSLNSVDWSPLMRRRCIACNDAFKLGDWVDAVTFGDHPWHSRNRKDLEQFAGLKVTSWWPTDTEAARTEAEDKWGDAAADVHIMRRAHKGFAEQPDTIAWNLNTGAMAINLAAHLGAMRIVLLGFDMHAAPDGRNNYHQTAPDSRGPERLANTYGRQIACMNQLADEIKAKTRVVVLNATRGTALSCFPKVELADVL